ncbi:MAG: deoxyribose-phosphate aldolase [Saprospiraceae bacterium]
MNKEQLVRYFDSTALKPDLETEAVVKLCEEAVNYNFASVCIPPYFVSTAYDILRDIDSVKVCTVVDFPFGYSSAFTKVESIKKSIDNGADELDVVINIPALKNGDWKTVRYDLEALSHSTHINDKILKVIIETCYLNPDEIEKIVKLCVDTGVDFAKTSTGYGTGGATVEDVKLMKQAGENNIKIKASGGIRSLDDALKMIEAGADRLGTSSAAKIIAELNK